MKKIYSYTDFARASQAHPLNEGLGFLSRLNPVRIISGAVQMVRDFIVWKKESKDPRFKKVRNVTDFLTDPKYAETFDELSDIQTTLIEKISQFKDENKKQYSKLKYKLGGEIEELYPRYMQKWQETVEMLYVGYYQEHGLELYDDVKDVVEFLRTSIWYRENRQKLEPIMTEFMDILGKSDIKKTLDNLL